MSKTTGQTRKPDADFNADTFFDALADLLSALAHEDPRTGKAATAKAWITAVTQIEASTGGKIAAAVWSDVDTIRAALRIAVVQAVNQIREKEAAAQEAAATQIWLERQQAWKRALKVRNTDA